MSDGGILCNLTHSSSESLKLPILPDLFCLVFVHCGFYCIFLLSREKGERKPRERKRKEPKGKGKKAAAAAKKREDEDGLTTKQRRKIVSKATISSSEGSDSEGEKLKIDVGA